MEAAVSILSALEKLHSNCLCHRDVRPCNVLCRKDSASTYTYILVDYSLSLTQFEDTSVSQQCKRLPYLSPEFFEGEAASPADDLWSVGVILYQLVSGQLPFQAEPAAKLSDWAACINKFEPPSVIYSDTRLAISEVRKCLDVAIKRALAKNPGQRFPTARAMIEGLPSERKRNKERFDALMSGPARTCLCRLWMECWLKLQGAVWEESRQCVELCLSKLKDKSHHSYALIQKSQGRMEEWDITALTQLLRCFYRQDMTNLSENRKLPHDKYIIKDEHGQVRMVKMVDGDWIFVNDTQPHTVQGADFKYLFERIGFQRNFYKHLSEIKDIPDEQFRERWNTVKNLLFELGEDSAAVETDCERILRQQ